MAQERDELNDLLNIILLVCLIGFLIWVISSLVNWIWEQIPDAKPSEEAIDDFIAECKARRPMPVKEESAWMKTRVEYYNQQNQELMRLSREEYYRKNPKE